MDNKTVFSVVGLCCTIIIFMGVALGDDQKEQAAERKSYCELVSMWEQDAEQGIEPVNRDGMPNYKGLECE
jgi:hypothetical protein